MQAYFITLHGWHAPAANTSKYSFSFCQSDIAYIAMIITKHNKEIDGGSEDAADNMRLDSCFIYPGV